MRKKGKITFWNDEKGYGFIAPDPVGERVFVHIRAFTNRHQLPDLNQPVTYSLSTDKQGRPCAVKVTRAGEQLPVNTKPVSSLLLVMTAVGFIAFVGWSVSEYNMPVQLLYLYLAASVFTFLIYARDKRAA